jgi:hypothetical protein
MSDLPTHLRAVADHIGLEAEAHQPDKRGIMALLGDMESAIHAMGEKRRFTLFVLRRDDLEAVIGAIKCARWAQEQQKKGKP